MRRRGALRSAGVAVAGVARSQNTYTCRGAGGIGTAPGGQLEMKDTAIGTARGFAWAALAAAGLAGAAPACAGDRRDGESATGHPGEGGGSPTQSLPPSVLSAGPTGVQLPAPEVALSELGFNLGSPEAPIKVIEFSDFGCGYCRRFHAETFPTLVEDYIETGRVEWKYVTFVSGMFSNGHAAAVAAECAGEQDRFDPMRDLLYERQSEWKNISRPDPVLEALAVEAGADAGEYRQCVAGERAMPRIRSGFLMAARAGVRGTPTFLVNGAPLVGAQPIGMWAEIFTAIEAEAGGATEPGEPGSSPDARP